MVELFVADGTMTGLYYQDRHMMRMFERYPEVILMDATYNLNNNRMPLYLMVTMDGSGQSEIVMACVTQLETEDAIQQMIRCFKLHNPSWNKIQVALMDKDMVERNVIKQEMPQANLGIAFSMF